MMFQQDADDNYRIINTASKRENYFLVSSGDGEITESS